MRQRVVVHLCSTDHSRSFDAASFVCRFGARSIRMDSRGRTGIYLLELPTDHWGRFWFSLPLGVGLGILVPSNLSETFLWVSEPEPETPHVLHRRRKTTRWPSQIKRGGLLVGFWWAFWGGLAEVDRGSNQPHDGPSRPRSGSRPPEWVRASPRWLSRPAQ